MNARSRSHGVTLDTRGAHYRIWAPGASTLKLRISPADGTPARTLELNRDQGGFYFGTDASGAAGDRYQFARENGLMFPDPASHFQPDGVHAASMIVDSSSYAWADAAWKRPPFRDLVIYELHIGTFTAEGTFESVIEKLPQLRDLGLNAIELMPVGDFPGKRNWGYDGVLIYAPARAYGQPDDLRALIDAAHQAGIAVILDVVYNHFGPDGNYLGAYNPSFFNPARHTPWGEAINFDGEGSAHVRSFFLENIIYWIEDFHFDGFRLDATHAIADRSSVHILEEIARTVRARGGYVIAEDERNEALIVSARAEGGYGFDGVWADDFCHTLQVALADDATYRISYRGSIDELVETLQHGWFFRGRHHERHGRLWGTACGHLPAERFIFCLMNHDQVGNRALGERLDHLISAEQFRAASALLCLAAYTPMIFMGQEWGASTPFHYFTDHHPELGKMVTEGRRKEFQHSPEFNDAKVAHAIPDPQSEKTFLRSKLQWEERATPKHAFILSLYQELLTLRTTHAAFRSTSRDTWAVENIGVAALRMSAENEEWLLLINLSGVFSCALRDREFCALEPGRQWQEVLATNRARFGGADDRESFNAATQTAHFSTAEALLLRSS